MGHAHPEKFSKLGSSNWLKNEFHATKIPELVPNIMARTELGRFPLPASTERRIIPFLNHIKNSTNSYLTLAAEIHEKTPDKDTLYFLAYKSASTKYGELLSHLKTIEPLKQRIKKLVETYYQNVWSSKTETTETKMFNHL